MMKYNPTLLLFVLLIQASLFGQSRENSLRSKENINENWTYSEDTSKDLEQALKADDWQKINLPHTWNATDPMDLETGYRRNSSWYKKNLELPKIASGTQYTLYFEGSNITTEVYINGQKAGEHIGGYVGFEIDITNSIEQGKNEILVRVDNGYNRDIIPSQKSDFFIYGGITRDVWLLIEPKRHISDLKIITPSVSEKKASLTVTASLENNSSENGMDVKAVLLDPKGKKSRSKREKPQMARSPLILEASKIRSCGISIIRISLPSSSRFWKAKKQSTRFRIVSGSAGSSSRTTERST